jgi:hypothetical protein
MSSLVVAPCRATMVAPNRAGRAGGSRLGVRPPPLLEPTPVRRSCCAGSVGLTHGLGQLADLGLQLSLTGRRAGPAGHQTGLADLQELPLQSPTDCSDTFARRAASRR